MKQKLLSIALMVLLLGSSNLLIAEKIDKNKAKSIALKHFSITHSGTNLRVASPTVKSVIPNVQGESNASYYVVNYKNGGFAIISGDDNAEPILGSSDVGTFVPDSIPEGLEFLLAGYDRYVKSIVANNVQDAEVQNKWEAIESGKKPNTSNARTLTETPIAPLTTTKWGQSYNNERGCGTHGTYNKFVPVTGCETKSCGKAYAGCVAVGFGQILGYWKYENSPDFDFDWENMPNALYNNSSEAEVNSVAKILKKCGDLVYMDYSCNGSGAYTTYVASALRNMGYSQSTYENRSSYTDEAWVEKIKDHLRRGVPVLYRGRSETDGHVMIFDGWSHDNYFHVNLGWTGYGDGNYYLVDDPEGFTKYHAAIFNIIPDNIRQEGANMDNPILVNSETDGSIYFSDNRDNRGYGNDYTGYYNQSSEDIFYKFTLQKNAEVEISTCGSGMSDTYIHLLDANGNMVYQNDEARESCPSTHYSYIKENLTAGTYFLVTEGYRDAVGVINTKIKTTASDEKEGSTLMTPIVLPQPTGDKWEYSYSDLKDNRGYGNKYTGTNNQPSEDIFYSFELKKKSEVELSTCGSPISDTYVHLLDVNGNMLYQNDEARESCSGTHHSYLKRILNPGVYYVVSESYTTGSGIINTQINTKEYLEKPGTSLEVAIPAFILRSNESTSDVTKVMSNVGMGDKFTGSYNQSSEDIFYSFELQTSADLVIKTCGSQLYDTYIHLLKPDGSEYLRNDDGGCDTYRQSTITASLSKGRYFVVAEAYSSGSGEITLTMSAKRNTPFGNLDFKDNASLSEGLNLEISELSVFPNPAENELTIVGTDLSISWEIISMSGRIVKSGSSENVDISSLNSGLWLIKISTDETSDFVRFIKK